MSDSAGKIRKSYVDHPKDRSKLTCIIHGPGNSSNECKVLRNFGSEYSKIMSTKDRGKDHSNTKKCSKKKERNDIVQHEVDDIILQYNSK